MKLENEYGIKVEIKGIQGNFMVNANLRDIKSVDEGIINTIFKNNMKVSLTTEELDNYRYITGTGIVNPDGRMYTFISLNKVEIAIREVVEKYTSVELIKTHIENIEAVLQAELEDVNKSISEIDIEYP